MNNLIFPTVLILLFWGNRSIHCSDTPFPFYYVAPFKDTSGVLLDDASICDEINNWEKTYDIFPHHSFPITPTYILYEAVSPGSTNHYWIYKNKEHALSILYKSKKLIPTKSFVEIIQNNTAFNNNGFKMKVIWLKIDKSILFEDLILFFSNHTSSLSKSKSTTDSNYYGVSAWIKSNSIIPSLIKDRFRNKVDVIGVEDSRILFPIGSKKAKVIQRGVLNNHKH